MVLSIAMDKDKLIKSKMKRREWEMGLLYKLDKVSNLASEIASVF